MFLQRIDRIYQNTNVSAEFEILSDDLLMVTIANDADSTPREIDCWRLLGTGQSSPLEIEIDADKRIISNLTLFIEKENFRPGRSITGTETNGNIVIDTKMFKENDSIDADGAYAVSVFNGTLMCIFNNCTRIHERFINGRIEYYFTYSDELCGFSVCNLSDEELKQLKILLNH